MYDSSVGVTGEPEILDTFTWMRTSHGPGKFQSIILTFNSLSPNLAGKQLAIFLTCASRRMIHLTWTQRKNLSAPWSTKGPNIMNYSLVSLADRGSSHTLYTEKNLKLNFRLPAVCLYHLSQQLWGNHGFIFLPTDWDLPHPNRMPQFVSLF